MYLWLRSTNQKPFSNHVNTWKISAGMKWGLSIVSSQRVLNSTLLSCSQMGIRDPWEVDFIERFAHLPWKSTLLTESHIIPTSFGFHSGNKVRDRHIGKSSLSMISKQAALGNLSRSLHWECAVPTRVSRWEILIYSFLFISVCSGFYSRAQPFFFCSSSQRNEFAFSL